VHSPLTNQRNILSSIKHLAHEFDEADFISREMDVPIVAMEP